MLVINLVFLISSKILLNLNNNYTDYIYIYSSIKTPIHLIIIFILGNKTSTLSINKHYFDIILFNDTIIIIHILNNIISILILWVFSVKIFSNNKLSSTNNILNDYYIILFLINLLYLTFNIIYINYYNNTILYINILFLIYLYNINLSIKVNFNFGNTSISNNISSNIFNYKYLLIFIN